MARPGTLAILGAVALASGACGGGGDGSAAAGPGPGQTADLPACPTGAVPGPRGPVAAELVGAWRFSDVTVEIGPDGSFVPNGAHSVDYTFTSDGRFTYRERISVLSDELPTGVGRCEKSVFSTTIGTVSAEGGTLRLSPTHGERIGQAQRCANDFLESEAWCPTVALTQTFRLGTDDQGGRTVELKDLNQGNAHVLSRQTGGGQ